MAAACLNMFCLRFIFLGLIMVVSITTGNDATTTPSAPFGISSGEDVLGEANTKTLPLSGTAKRGVQLNTTEENIEEDLRKLAYNLEEVLLSRKMQKRIWTKPVAGRLPLLGDESLELAIGDAIFQCTFEDGDCFYDTRRAITWFRTNGQQIPRRYYMAPSVDHTLRTTSGYFMYASVSNKRSGDYGVMVLNRAVTPSSGTSQMCADFWFVADGLNIGLFGMTVYQQRDPRATMVWSQSGSKGSYWWNAKVTFPVRGNVPLIITFGVQQTRRNGRGGVGIDDVTLKEGSCQQESVANQWGAWQEWAQCTATCGNGVRVRRRTCDKTNCVGLGVEVYGCAIQPCNDTDTVDGWQNWGPCSVPCGNGFRSRLRNCSRVDCTRNVTEIEQCSNGGCTPSAWSEWNICSVSCGQGYQSRTLACTGNSCTPLRQTKSCYLRVCGSGPGVGIWQPWSTCSVSCDGGFRSRSKLCPEQGGCPGARIQTGVCRQESCSQEWSQWLSWSACSAPCGDGFETRTRSCGGNNCFGSGYQTRGCYIRDCIGRWKDWAEWTECSVTCGSGSRQRTRACDGPTCEGSSFQTIICNVEKCKGRWSNWETWTPCSSSCSHGFRIRRRVCEEGNCEGPLAVSQICNLGACPALWGQWSDWDSCTETCGSGFRYRRRSCGGQGCIGRTAEGEYCNTEDCPGSWRLWGPWTNCPVTCGQGVVLRERTCVGVGCPGSDQETQFCIKPDCPGSYGDWSPWGACSVSCGTGTRTRKRPCSGQPCSGVSAERASCHEGECEASELVACGSSGQQIHKASGTIQSPNFGAGQTYPKNAKCSWLISLPDKQMVVSLTLETFMTEERFDQLHVYDGDSVYDQELEVFSGERTGEQVNSTGPEMFLVFQTDYATELTGFRLQFKSIQPDNDEFYHCGVTSTTTGEGLSYIYGGKQAPKKSWPWAAQLFIDDILDNMYCGATILTSKHLLTAAYCLFYKDKPIEPSNLYVRIGSQKLRLGSKMKVESYTIYKGSDPTSSVQHRDVAVLRLARDIIFTEKRKPVCLSTRQVGTGFKCVAVGWGATENDGGESLDLREVELEIVDSSQCGSDHGTAIPPGHICAGANPSAKGTGPGDGGGGLVCLYEGRYHLTGITSFSHPARLAPDTFINVYLKRKWIKSVIQEDEEDPDGSGEGEYIKN